MVFCGPPKSTDQFFETIFGCKISIFLMYISFYKTIIKKNVIVFLLVVNYMPNLGDQINDEKLNLLGGVDWKLKL
jgi:hypothetical protein